jgi:hypothetical protein
LKGKIMADDEKELEVPADVPAEESAKEESK